jgi:hypothetical protein
MGCQNLGEAQIAVSFQVMGRARGLPIKALKIQRINIFTDMPLCY